MIEAVSDTDDCESDLSDGESNVLIDDSDDEVDAGDIQLYTVGGFDKNSSAILIISAALIMMVIQKNVSVAAFSSMMEVMLVSCLHKMFSIFLKRKFRVLKTAFYFEFSGASPVFRLKVTLQ